MYKLYRFEMDYGRNGSLDGLFISTDEELNLINNATIYFGEALGKHSEVWIDDFEWEKCCTVISDEQEKIEWLIDLMGYTLTGYNPLDYFEYTESSEYQEGYDADLEDMDCEYEMPGEIARWFKGKEDRRVYEFECKDTDDDQDD